MEIQPNLEPSVLQTMTSYFNVIKFAINKGIFNADELVDIIKIYEFIRRVTTENNELDENIEVLSVLINSFDILKVSIDRSAFSTEELENVFPFFLDRKQKNPEYIEKFKALELEIQQAQQDTKTVKKSTKK